MKKALLPLVLLFVFVAFFFIQAFYPLPFPEDKLKQLLATSNFLNHQYPQEKIYLQFDRPSYWANQDIWFKSYLKNSPIQDCNLYVELLNSSGTVIQKKIYWAQNGLAYGDLHSEDTISSGVYQIRAYTNWMRNFDEQWFFRKNLLILNIRDKVIHGAEQLLSRKDIDIQFLPEGGTFLANVNNKIAFKATDKYGKGLNVDGRIVDDKGTELTKIKSQFRGMGNFVVQPQEGRTYQAEVIVAGNFPMTVQLPAPQAEGISLSVNSADTSLINIQIVQSPNSATDTVPAEYMLVGQTNGTVFYRKQVTMKSNIYRYDIEKFKLPTGIIQFTLFDQNVIPLCERLAFVNHHDFVKLEIKPDKASYLTREKVNLDVSAKSVEGLPCLTNLSVSVYNPEALMKSEAYPDNILTHFMLSSELKGILEEPAYYFKDDSLTTLTALDNLMLTHGYRHFEWKAVKENWAPSIDYLPEGSITINGTVENSILKKVVPGSKVTLLFQNYLSGVHEQTADSLGRFSFSNLFFNDTAFVSIQALNSKGKRNTWIELDQQSSISPEVNLLPFIYQYTKANQMGTTSYLSEVGSELISKKWHLSDTILLNDFNVVATRVKKGDGHIRMYVVPDAVFDMTKQDDVYGSIFDMMNGRLPGIQYDEINKNFFIRNNVAPARLYLDGIPTDKDLIATLPASSFDKVEVIKSTVQFGPSGAIFFYSKDGGKFKNPATDKQGMKSARIIGYSVIRKFYAPQYESKIQPTKKTDFRSTLYWNPIVQTDSTGVSNVSFYNSDQTGDVDIEVEGVTSDGKLCRGVGSYKVITK